MHKAVISGTGLYTPANSISNEELVVSFNAYVQQFNADNAEAIERGEVAALTESNAAFIEKASSSSSFSCGITLDRICRGTGLSS